MRIIQPVADFLFALFTVISEGNTEELIEALIMFYSPVIPLAPLGIT